MEASQYLSVAFLLFITIQGSSGLECYSCFNVKGANAIPLPGLNYGDGCDSKSLSKGFKTDCYSSKSLEMRKYFNFSRQDLGGKAAMTDCIKLETTVGNISVVVRDCGLVAASYKKKCTTEAVPAGSPIWRELQTLERIYLSNTVLPNDPPPNTNLNICACDKNNCNGAGNLGPQSLALVFSSILLFSYFK